MCTLIEYDSREHASTNIGSLIDCVSACETVRMSGDDAECSSVLSDRVIGLFSDSVVIDTLRNPYIETLIVSGVCVCV